MIDLHSHILPGLDDGAPDIDVSLAMARAAVDAGIETMVATPHVNFEYPVDPHDIGPRVGALNIALARSEIALAVLPGAEVALPRLGEMDDEALRAVCLGGGPCVLVESPYVRGASFLEERLFDLQLRGLRPMLAHPERCPIFQDDPGRLARVVERGVLCSINIGSLTGRFGSVVRRFSVRLFRDGLVHNVASDCHDPVRRPPGLRAGFEKAEEELPGISDQADWYARAAPAAILAGEPLPPRPDSPSRRPSRLRRLIGLR